LLVLKADNQFPLVVLRLDLAIELTKDHPEAATAASQGPLDAGPPP
jgi:hypothetical protein